jgi:hypothetical protein
MSFPNEALGLGWNASFQNLPNKKQKVKLMAYAMGRSTPDSWRENERPRKPRIYTTNRLHASTYMEQKLILLHFRITCHSTKMYLARQAFD